MISWLQAASFSLRADTSRERPACGLCLGQAGSIGVSGLLRGSSWWVNLLLSHVIGSAPAVLQRASARCGLPVWGSNLERHGALCTRVRPPRPMHPERGSRVLRIHVRSPESAGGAAITPGRYTSPLFCSAAVGISSVVTLSMLVQITMRCTVTMTGHLETLVLASAMPLVPCLLI